VVSAQDEVPYEVEITGPTYLGLGQSGSYAVHVTGGPGGKFNYSAQVSTIAALVTPSSGSSNGTFNLTVKAPAEAQDVVLTVNVTSSTGAKISSSERYTIKIVEPVVIKATVKNAANMTVSNVPIEFWADGQVLNSTTFTINGNSTKTVMYNWTSPSIAPGLHNITIKIDPNNQFVKFATGGSEYSTTIYIGDPGFGTWNLVLAIALAFLLFFAFTTYMNKGKKKKKK